MLTPLNLYEAAAVLVGFFPDIFTFSVRAYWKLRDLMSERRFDVIHDNQTLGYGLLLMKTLGVPIVATIHHPITVDLAASVEESKTWRRRIRWVLFYSFLTMQARVARRMDRVISVSAASGEDTIHDFRLRRERVRTVHNGIDTDIFRRLEEVERVPNRLVIVGKVQDRTKGVPFLLEAVRLLRGDVDLDVRVVGDQGPDGYAERLVGELGIDDRVTFTGRLDTDDLVRLYSSAEVAVTASVYEGFGLPAAEAMSCGTPVIASRAGALPEVVGDDGSGMLVPPADPPALAAAIKSLLSDDERRARMRGAARRRIEERFSWEVAARESVKVYEELL
jgi:glycosyltransferase involved in cell wall biosynthesis